LAAASSSGCLVRAAEAERSPEVGWAPGPAAAIGDDGRQSVALATATAEGQPGPAAAGADRERVSETASSSWAGWLVDEAHAAR
jgi:hypothetical protein